MGDTPAGKIGGLSFGAPPPFQSKQTHGYYRTHQPELRLITNVGDSELSDQLQSIIDSPGEPQHS